MDVGTAQDVRIAGGMTAWMRFGLLALAVVAPGGILLAPLVLAWRSRAEPNAAGGGSRWRTWWARGDLTGRPSFSGNERSCR